MYIRQQCLYSFISEDIKLLILVGAWGLFQKLPYHRLTYWYTRSKLNENIYEWTGKYSSFIRWALEYSLFGDETEISSE